MNLEAVSNLYVYKGTYNYTTSKKVINKQETNFHSIVAS